MTRKLVYPRDAWVRELRELANSIERGETEPEAKTFCVTVYPDQQNKLTFEAIQ